MPLTVDRLERLPPYSEEAECGVLGACLLEAERVIDLCIERRVDQSSFYISSHGMLFSMIQDMFNACRPIDLITVGEEARARSISEQIGGDIFIEGLLDSTPTALHAEHYIEVVLEKQKARDVISKCRMAIESAYEPNADIDKVLNTAQDDLFRMTMLQAKGTASVPELLNDTMEEIDCLYKDDRPNVGVPTGFQNLDNMLIGLQDTDMIILAARPSMGKTSLALNIAELISLGVVSDKIQRHVGVFSLEMSCRQLMRRMVCSRARVSAHKLNAGYVSQESYRNLVYAASELKQSKMHINDTSALDIAELRSAARTMKRKHDVGLVVVDYLQLMYDRKNNRDGRNREISAISAGLKQMAKELEVPVLVLSQLSRSVENRGAVAKPKLSDLRDSGSIEQDADVVMLMRRPCKYEADPESDDKRLAIVDIAKHRNGPTGEVRLNFDEDLMRFTDRREGVDDDPFEQHEQMEVF